MIVDPIVGYRHPNHIAIYEASVKAFFAAADPDQYPSGLPLHPLLTTKTLLSRFSPTVSLVYRMGYALCW
jgi:LmbE family N-acetylglucosaminyl deacetylase